MEDKLKEECGIIGICRGGKQPVAAQIGFGLVALQHRGEESCGIATYDQEQIHYHKGMGLVQDVFNSENLSELSGNIGIGHVRYSTSGESHIANAQPLVVHYKGGGIALAHNGNLVNADQLRDQLIDKGAIFQTTGDSEVIAHTIATHYKKGLIAAIEQAVSQIRGAFALAIVCDNKLVAVRDPYGLRPLCIGRLDNGYVIASESCALDVIGAEFVRDVDKGEMVVMTDQQMTSHYYDPSQNYAHCVFEYVYFSRPDSYVDGRSVYMSRVKAGEILYREYPIEADVVMAVPDSGIDAAIGYSRASGIPYGIGLIKNKYIGRSFIQPDQASRELAVRLKLNPLKETIKDKRIILIDDSIVRGTTSKRIVESIRQAGAKQVHVLVSSPPVVNSCYYGIDTPDRKKLVGVSKTTEQIGQIIKVDSLGYISLAGLVEATGLTADNLCLACFNGHYPCLTSETKGKIKAKN